jgi:NAD+-dependent protein deacetylase SIR2
MFDIEVFRHDPHIFYSFAKKILPSILAYSPTHAFLRLLQDKDKLLRVYTQNIDNLEQLAGVKDEKLVQCHGSFATASCMRCTLQVSGDEIREDILNGEVPKCPACEVEREQQQQKSKGKKRRRNNDWDGDDDDEDDDIIEGIMKVPITICRFLICSPISPFSASSCRKSLIILCSGRLDSPTEPIPENVTY